MKIMWHGRKLHWVMKKHVTQWFYKLLNTNTSMAQRNKTYQALFSGNWQKAKSNSFLVLSQKIEFNSFRWEESGSTSCKAYSSSNMLSRADIVLYESWIYFSRQRLWEFRRMPPLTPSLWLEQRILNNHDRDCGSDIYVNVSINYFINDLKFKLNLKTYRICKN